jgi:organic radical activating enzyme
VRLDYVEFYITNVCNLTCEGCNRFNNYKFKGYQRWDDHKEIYKEWGKELRVNNIAILGGEPLLNPDFTKWLTGIQNIWPDSRIEIVTNGYRLNYIKGLYDQLNDNKNLWLNVGIHNKQSKKLILENIKNFLVEPLRFEYNQQNKYGQFLYITDANNVKIKVEYNWWFHQGALIKEENKFGLHQSDVKKAHDICHMKTCHHFIEGKLYKCGVVALLPKFAEQFQLQLSAEDKELMLNYVPLTIKNSIDEKKDFIQNLKNSIPQCKFCPEQYNGKQIYAIEK